MKLPSLGSGTVTSEVWNQTTNHRGSWLFYCPFSIYTTILSLFSQIHSCLWICLMFELLMVAVRSATFHHQSNSPLMTQSAAWGRLLPLPLQTDWIRIQRSFFLTSCLSLLSSFWTEELQKVFLSRSIFLGVTRAHVVSLQRFLTKT